MTAPSVSAAKLTTYGKSVIDCLLALHRPQAKAQGFTIDTPKFVTFAGTERTACGVIADEQVGVYCGRNKTIYISTVADDWKNTYRGARLGYLWVISHEFAHHLQASTGLLRDSDSKDLKESRRIELMANCASGVFFGAVWTQLGGGPVEYKQLRSALQSTYANEVPGRGTHGSPASAVLWFDRGFKHEYAAYARCNTFRAPSSEVR
ncbi:MAG: neutral zinc metallopeptidase [Micropruina sp.]|nr:neutral zinc metallopeptidase [Micropruina sp.]